MLMLGYALSWMAMLAVKIPEFHAGSCWNVNEPVAADMLGRKALVSSAPDALCIEKL